MTSTYPSESAAVRRQVQSVLAASWLVALVVVAFAGAAYLRAILQPDVYGAEAEVRVFNATNPGLGTGGAARVDPVREVQTQARYMTSVAVRTEVRRRLGEFRAEKVQAVRVSPVPDSDLLRVVAESRSPPVAQAAAQTYADVYVETRRAAITGSLRARADELRAEAGRLQEEVNVLDQRIASLVPPPTIDRTGRVITLPDSEEVKSLRLQRSSLVDRVTEANNVAQQLALEASIRQTSLEVVNPAERPTSPVRPVPLRDAAVGAVLGLFAGIAVALLRERMNDGVRTIDEMQAAVRPLPVLALIPLEKSAPRPRGELRPARWASQGPTRVATVDPSMPAAESFRTLRAALLFSGTDDDARSLLVTSSVTGEGKTTVAVNLAVTMARAGSRVLLVDADLKRPNVHRQFDLANEKGLTALLRGEIPSESAAVPTDLGGSGTLDVIVAGTGGWQATELLASGRAGPWLADLQRSYDHVLVDSAPVLSGADPLALARLVSGIVLVARMGVRRRDLEMSKDRLEQVSVSLLGVVANAVSPSHAGYYYYSDRSGPDRGRHRRAPRWGAGHDGDGKVESVGLRQVGEVAPEAQVDLGEGAR